MEALINFDFGLGVLVLVLVGFDLISGLIKAFALNEFSSTTMRQGLFRKAGTILILLLAALLSVACNITDLFPQEFSLVYAPACAVLIFMEVASILENIGEINPELYDYKIFEIFSHNREKEETIEDNTMGYTSFTDQFMIIPGDTDEED